MVGAEGFFMHKWIIISVIVLLIAVPAGGFEIIGVGDDPSTALRDALRQVAECFGGVAVDSETNVRNFQTERDVVDLKSSFNGGKLDRFFKGVEYQEGRFVATFDFPDSFLRGLHSGKRDSYRKRLVVSFDVIFYGSEVRDSFGEVKRKGWKFKVPACVRRFVDFFILDIDDSKGFEWVKESG